MARLFGTDGVRGRANGDLTARLALDLSVSAARVLGEAGELTGSEPGGRSVAVVGRDTRVSGQFLESAVVAGLASAGVDVVLLDVLPTPGVAHLTNALGADLGVMISASHNPMPDNGIKFFARGGRKLDDVLEDAIEARLGQPWSAPTGGDVGRVSRHVGAAEDYVTHLLATRGMSLAGITVVLDCAHGAASVVGPAVLRAAGAELITICAEPDGLNINDGCGSTHLEPLREAVLEHRADVGFALDGDADRVLAVDATGEVVDGDQLLAVLAVAMRDQGRLHADSVVVTVMSNLGFGHAMDQAGIGVLRTSVGDRYVLEEMGRTGHNLGGEQSGHVIMSDHATTGDGLLAALQVLDRMALTRCSIADLAGVMGRLPQVMLNVAGVDRARTDDAELLAAVAEEETGLGETGRILLRPSGTEPLVRVMVEAPTHEQAGAVAERLAAVVRRRITL